MKLEDIISLHELDEALEEGWVRKQVHPSLPISILNYTEKCVYSGSWNKTTLRCRGLIFADEDGSVVASGMRKFFNYGQTGAPEIPLNALTRVTRKHDGSLGIGWTYDGHYGIATRGSFTSAQAMHASANMTEIERKAIRDASIFRGDLGGSTQIWEIIAPFNRIVLDYGDFDGLLPLGLVDNQDGKIHFRPEEIYTTGVITFAEAIALPILPDEEGYVLDVQPFGESHHVKLKGEDYKLLHGLLTNTNARRIWVQLAARGCHHWINEPEEWANKLGHDPKDFERVDVEKDIVDTFLKNVPDEFYNWVTRQIDSINDRVSDLVIQSILLAGNLSMVDDKRTRYETVKDHPMCKEILNYVESRDESILILKAWKLAKPAGDDTPFKTQGDED